MEREACCTNDLLNFGDEISWITSELYDSKREECQVERSKDSFRPKGTKKHQYRRQSEPVVSDIVEVLSPKLMNQNIFAGYSGSNDEFGCFSYSHKGNMKQTLMLTKSAENSPQIRRRYKSSDKCFVVNLYIEAKASHLGPFPFEIYPKMNVGLLKLKVEKELDIPTSYQKWILNRSLAIDNDLLLLDCDVGPGSPLFLYLDSNFEKSIDINRLYSLGKTSANKSTHRPVDFCQNTLKQYPLKSCDPENTKRFVSGSKLGAYSEENLPMKKYETTVLANFIEQDRRKKKILEPHLESCSLKSTFVKSESGNVAPVKEVAALSYYKNLPDTKKGPFKPVFAKVKEKENHTSLNNISNIVGCPPETGVSVILSSEIKTKIASSEFQTSTGSVVKDILKSQIQTEAMKMQIDSNKELSNHPVETRTNAMGIIFSETKKQDTHDLKESVIGADTKIPILSLKSGQNSILEKVRMRHKNKLTKENEKASTKNTQCIQNILSRDKITEKSTQQVIDVNTPDNDILPQSNLQTEFSNVVHDFSRIIQSESNIDNNENKKEMGTNELIHKQDEIPNFVDISAKNLEAEDLTSSSETPSIVSHKTGVFRKSDIIEICIVNNNDKSSAEVHCKDSNSSHNITDTSGSSNVGQDVQEEENEITIKKCAENYEHLLKVEDLSLVRNVVNFTCPICFGDFQSDEGAVLHECLHTFCIDCLARTIDYAEEVLVKCPYRNDEYSCQSYLQQREIKAVVSPEIYERYLQRSIITAESLAEKSFHCKTPDCPGWCMFDDNINVFRCPVCFHYNCLNCRTIHEGLNCRQYQIKLQSEKKLDPDSEKTLDFLNKMIEAGKALRCPKCDLILMKKWGCDWLKCALCLTEICWITKGPRWGPAGQGDTSGGCRCGVNGVKCHPSCTYCH